MRCNPYDILGVDQKLTQGRIEHPDLGRVRRAWVGLVEYNHPDSALSDGEVRFREVMAAGLFLLSAQGDLYRREVSLPEDMVVDIPDYTEIPIPSVKRIFLRIAREKIAEMLGEHDEDDFEARTTAAAEILEAYFPAFISAEDLAEEPRMDISAIEAGLAKKHDEIGRVSAKGIVYVWRRGFSKYRGAIVKGKAKKIPSKTRALMSGGEARAPYGEIELSLAYWLVAENYVGLELQERLVFHELLHFGVNDEGKFVMRPHEVETFVEELANYGPENKLEASAAIAIAKHPDTRMKLRWWDLEAGQLSFLSPSGDVEEEEDPEDVPQSLRDSVNSRTGTTRLERMALA